MKPINEYTLQECLEEIRPKTMEVSLPGYKRLADLADRIHELTRWIPVGERLPTEEDADENGAVFAHAIRRKHAPTTDAWYWDAVTEIGIGSHKPTHWRRIDKP